MNITLKDIIKVIDQELQWCFDNPDKSFHKEYRKGFTNGLIQAKYLISEMYRAIKEEPKFDSFGKQYYPSKENDE